MKDSNWDVPPSGHLNLDFPAISRSVRLYARDAFVREVEAANLLLKLARALGEHRAPSMHFEEYQRGLFLPNGAWDYVPQFFEVTQSHQGAQQNSAGSASLGCTT